MRDSDWYEEDEPIPPAVNQSIGSGDGFFELLLDDDEAALPRVKLKDPFTWWLDGVEKNLLAWLELLALVEDEVEEDDEEDEERALPSTSWPLGRVNFCGQTGENLLTILVARQWVGVIGGMNRSEPTGGAAYGIPRNTSTGLRGPLLGGEDDELDEEEVEDLEEEGDVEEEAVEVDAVVFLFALVDLPGDSLLTLDDGLWKYITEPLTVPYLVVTVLGDNDDSSKWETGESGAAEGAGSHVTVEDNRKATTATETVIGQMKNAHMFLLAPDALRLSAIFDSLRCTTYKTITVNIHFVRWNEPQLHWNTVTFNKYLHWNKV